MNDDGVIHRLVGKAAEAMGGPVGEAIRPFVFKSAEDRLAKSQLIFIRYVPGVQLRQRSGKSSYESRKLQFGFPVSHGSLIDRKSTRLNSSHMSISYAVFCLKKK